MLDTVKQKKLEYTYRQDAKEIDEALEAIEALAPLELHMLRECQKNIEIM